MVTIIDQPLELPEMCNVTTYGVIIFIIYGLVDYRIVKHNSNCFTFKELSNDIRQAIGSKFAFKIMVKIKPPPPPPFKKQYKDESIFATII